ncbi:MAG TPA: amidohydrolase family protein [Fimbriimonas sp.]|nr:amidohydrolase family protein [Fimbriimonas sp.]
MTFLVAAVALQTSYSVIQNVSIITPGETKVQKAKDVAFDGKQILWIKNHSNIAAAPDVRLIDGSGKFLIPGLWDMHTHLSDGKSLGLFTANGVTGIRVMFGATYQLSLRKDVQNGKILGPTMVLGSPIVDGPKPIWPGSIAVSNAEQARVAVRKIKQDGYDFVKVYSLLSREAYFAIADECKKEKIPFAGHVPHSVGLLEAQKAGQISAEHVMGNLVECSTHADEFRQKFDQVVGEGMAKTSEMSRAAAAEIIDSFSAEKEKALVKGLKGGALWQCPTLVVLRNVAYMNDGRFGSDPRNKYVNPFVLNGWDPAKDFRLKNRTAVDWERAQKSYLATFQFTKKLVEGGANVLAGTDCLNPFVYPGFSLHDELDLLVKVGMSPTQALASATVNPARFLGLSKTHGRIEIGKVADLVLLTANPLEDIRNTTKIDMVVNSGKVFDRSELDKVLAERSFVK